MSEPRRPGSTGALLGLAVRPDLWLTAAVLVCRLARPGWWRHWPPLPGPDPEYLRFRAQTAFGDPAATPTSAELVDYVAWCRRMASLRRLRARR